MLNRSNNLKLRGRILWGYSVPILLSVGVAALVYVNVKGLDNELRIDETVHEINEGNKDVELELESMQRAAHDYVITRNKANLAEYEREKSEFDETTAALKLLARDSRGNKVPIMLEQS